MGDYCCGLQEYTSLTLIFTLPLTGERSMAISVSVCVCVCVCVCVFVCPRSYLRTYTSDLQQVSCACYLCRGSPSGGVVIRCVLPVLWMASYLLISQGCARRRCPAEAQCTRSLGLGYKLCAVIPVAGQRTHGTTFRALKVTFQLATPGAESAVCDCLVRQEALVPQTDRATRNVSRNLVNYCTST